MGTWCATRSGDRGAEEDNLGDGDQEEQQWSTGRGSDCAGSVLVVAAAAGGLAGELELLLLGNIWHAMC
ncbi:hypothetical protein OPV22_008934 [Ensete ventricosum]|uniref:Uncharacterized protein n=1 Tax=Ensete ventricosum TaxID=4639 RepID=A0AAV8RC76_ENSVE|nr:hypothetical protein OPV22_008934 [Ensete ventricosum]